MSNLCLLSCTIQGSPDNCRTFLDALQGKGKTWIGSGIVVLSLEEISQGAETVIHVEGRCKNSVSSALIRSAIMMQEIPGSWIWEDPVTKQWMDGHEAKKRGYRILTLQEATQEFEIEFEAWSEEHEIGFSEHLLIINGETVRDEIEEIPVYSNVQG